MLDTGGIILFGCFTGAVVLSRRNSLSTLARRRVSEDWTTVLPREKTQLFENVVRRWECLYAMMSVALDEALSLRARGELVCARQQVSVAADLLERLAASLDSSCGTISTRGRRVAHLPAVEPLNAKFFRGNTAQSAASWNAILHHVFIRDRSRFFHKLRILSSTLQQLEREFCEAAGDISKGLSVQPFDAWTKLDHLHYDFNTCLRETEVLLKSFLRSLPAEQLPALASELDAPPAPRSVRMKPRLSRAPA
jgi:hypothetical protein